MASAFAVTMAMAAAAATVTVVPPFSPLFALGVLDEPESLLSADFDVSLPSFRLSSALPLTSLLELSVEVSPESFFPGAPAELAFDSVSLTDAPSAAKLTAPPAPARLRLSCELTM